MKDLILEPISDELLVYDPETHEAHALSGEAATKLNGARVRDRRQVLKLILAAGAGVITSVAPLVADAASQCVDRCGFRDNGKKCGRHCRGTCEFGGCL